MFILIITFSLSSAPCVAVLRTCIHSVVDMYSRNENSGFSLPKKKIKSF